MSQHLIWYHAQTFWIMLSHGACLHFFRVDILQHWSTTFILRQMGSQNHNTCLNQWYLIHLLPSNLSQEPYLLPWLRQQSTRTRSPGLCFQSAVFFTHYAILTTSCNFPQFFYSQLCSRQFRNFNSQKQLYPTSFCNTYVLWNSIYYRINSELSITRLRQNPRLPKASLSPIFPPCNFPHSAFSESIFW